MSLNRETIALVDNHWAVLAIGTAARDRGIEVANARLVAKAVGQQMCLSYEERPNDEDMLRRLALAYEMAAIEGLPAFLSLLPADDNLRHQCIAGAWRTFELRRLFGVPEPIEERIFHVLHLAALAYCGDRWSDIRRWFAENPESISEPSTADQPWHYRLLYRLFDC